MLLLEPSNAQNMGFTLSVLSVLGLTVFAGLGQAWVRAALPSRTPRFVGESLALTCISQAFTMPVSLPAFGNLALLAPLANVLVGPLVSALLVVGLACVPLAALAPAWAVGAAMLPCDVLAGASCALAGWMAGIPGTAIMLEAGAPLLGAGLLLGSCALYALWPAPSRRVLWAVLAVFAGFLGCCVLYWRFLAPPRVVVLDVGQGDAILVQDGPHALLVDTGPGDAVCYALARTCVLYLDAVVLTHTDSDHAGGLEELASQVGVGCLAVAWGVPDAVERNEPRAWESIEGVGAPVVELDAGDVLAVGRFDLEVLWPLEPVEGDENEDSLVMLLTYAPQEGGGPTFSALLTGDAEAPVLDALLVREEIGPVDLLKLGHHGSAASTSESMLDILDPLVAVASAGANNRYGHPSQECVEVCEKAGVPLLCTAQTGDVAFYMEGDSVRMVLENAA